VKNDPSSAKDSTDTNSKINEQLADELDHTARQSEAETANMELQKQFNHDDNEEIRTLPTAIFPPQ
jgi:hypothetical protein